MYEEVRVRGTEAQNQEHRVATFTRSCMNGSLPFKRTIEQATGTMPLASKTIAAATLEDQ